MTNNERAVSEILTDIERRLDDRGKALLLYKMLSGDMTVEDIGFQNTLFGLVPNNDEDVLYQYATTEPESIGSGVSDAEFEYKTAQAGGGYFR